MTATSIKEQVTELDQVKEIIQQYFEGLHYGDTEKLRAIFHPDTVLKAPGIRRSLEQWLELVGSREVPQQQGADFNYRVLSIELINQQAMVKLLCPLLGSEFIDFIGLLKEQGKWLIVNKMYAEQ